MTRVVVVDLDECLCTINSFRYWMVFSFLFLMLSFRWLAFYRFNKCIFLRAFHSDRVKMKRDILAVTEGLPQFFIAFFSGFMHRYTNVDVVLEMEKYKKKGVPIVLCTAAPVCYVSFFSKKFRFLHVFATPSVLTPGWKENIGKEKLASLEKCFGKNLVIECVITDHHDDLPLLLLARKRILVAPSKSTLSVLSGRFEYEVIS